MTERARRGLARTGLVLLVSGAALLAGCGQDRTAASNVVEMRDMDVVDGTVNDAMTDLDAVSTGGIGQSENAGNSTVARQPAPAEESVPDAEAVPAD